MNLSTLYKKLTNRKYTIGYKFILSLFVPLIGLTTFCSAIDLSVNGGDFEIFHLNSSSYSTTYNFSSSYQFMLYNFVDGGGSNKISGYCATSSRHCEFQPTDIVNSFNVNNYTSVLNKYITLSGNCRDTCSFTVYQNMSVDILLYNPNGGGSCPDCPTCPNCDPQYTSEQCQSVYGLVSSGDYNNCQLDLNTCQSNTSGFNNLLNNCNNDLNACNNSLTNCLQQNCPETVTGINRSTLYINDIQYPGAPTIKFTIPEEIERDQNTDEEETNIDVIGYGYDQDKMQQMVNTQYYKPTAEEMSGLMEKVAEFLPLVAVALLIARIRRVIKKVF